MKSSRVPVILIALAAFSFMAGGCDILVTERGGENEPCEDSDCDQGLVCINDVCVDDAGCNDLCEPAGKSRCRPGGLAVENCAPVGDCLGWVQDIDCGANSQVCNPDPNPHCEGCESNCPQAGDLRCRFGDDAVEECTDMGDGCLIWTDKESCADIGQICIENPNPHCQDGCQSNCPNDGVIRCHPTDPTVEVCAPDGDCINWQLQEDCGQNGNICIDDGTPHCEPGCNHICSLNDTRCTPDQQGKDICLPDGDGCRVWQFQDNCTGDEHCNDSTGSAICEVNCQGGTDTCPALGEERCSPDSTIVETCVYDANWCRNWDFLKSCVDQGMVCQSDGSNPVCASDSCAGGDECATSGELRCSADPRFIEECREDTDTCLRWLQYEDCESITPGFVCQNNTCADPCTGVNDCDNEGDLRCGGNDWVEKCVMEGDNCRRWQQDIDCPSLDSQCVDTDTPQCECISHGCLLGDVKCSDDYNALLECKPDPICRQWMIREDCASMSLTCIEIAGQDPACHSCKDDCMTVGALHCAGTVVEKCENPVGSTCTMFRPSSDCADNGQVCEQLDTQVTCRTIAPHCTNGSHDFDESDVDCGGADCLRCGGHRGCTVALDCLSEDCATNLCQLPIFCNDGTYQPELGEHGPDCGGPCLGCLGDPCSDNDHCNYDVWCNDIESKCKNFLDTWNLGLGNNGAIKSVDLSGPNTGAFANKYFLTYSNSLTSLVGLDAFDAIDIFGVGDQATLSSGHTGPIESVAFAPGAGESNHDLLATGGQTLAHWPYQDLDGNYGAPSTIAGSHDLVIVEPNGRYIATADGPNGDITLFDVQGNYLTGTSVAAPINDMAFSIYTGSEPAYLVIAAEGTSSRDGITILTINSNPGPQVSGVATAAKDMICRSITINNDPANGYVAATCGAMNAETIEIVDLTGTHKATSSNTGYSTVAFHPVDAWNHYLFAGTHSGSLAIFDLSTGGFPPAFPEMCNRSFDSGATIYDLAFTRPNAWMAIASWEKITLLDTAQWMPLLQQGRCWMPSP